MAKPRLVHSSSPDPSLEELLPSRKAAAIAQRAIGDSVEVKRKLSQECTEDIVLTVRLVAAALLNGKKVIFFGNGGSAADAQHIAAELVGKFNLVRRPFNALSLTTNTSVLSAIGNDFGFDETFSRQVQACVVSGDVAIGISTSGRSKNVIKGIQVARKRGATTIALTGGDGGSLAALCDHSVIVPSKDVQRIQECHILVGHIMSELVEQVIVEKDQHIHV